MMRGWGFDKILRRSVAVLAVISIALATGGTVAQAAGKKPPRFAALRADEVNLRTGPGIRYPVEWIFRRKNLPVQIIADFTTWRQVRDSAGTVGWVHKSMLTGRRMVMIVGRRQPLFRKPIASAKVVAYIDEKVIARLLGCEGKWCGIEVAGYNGWMPRSRLWGVGKSGKDR